MAIEVEYFRPGRHDCNRVLIAGEVIGPDVKDGVINCFKPTIVDALCSSDEEYANVKVGIDKRRVAVRLWEGENHTNIIDTSTPILLKVGQVLQIGSRFDRSIDIRLQPALMSNRIDDTIKPVQIKEQPIEEL